MNRQQLAERMSHYVRLTPGQAFDAIRAFEHAVIETVVQGEPVAIGGFGMFEIGSKPSGERALVFRQALTLKAELNSETAAPGIQPSRGTHPSLDNETRPEQPINRAATR